MPVNEPTQKAAKFIGLQTAHDAKEIGLNGFTVAKNIDLTSKRHVRRRDGYVRRYNGVIDSAWCDDELCLLTSGATLLRLNTDWTTTQIRADLTTGGAITAYRLSDTYFYSNGFETGVFRNGVHDELGLPVPAAPALAVTAGSLPVGKYRVALSYVRADGQQSGVSAAREIDLTAVGGIAITGIPVPANTRIQHVAIFVTAPNGELLRFTAAVARGTTSYTIGAEQLYEPTQNQYLIRPPGFQIAEFFGSRMLYVANDMIWYSLKYGYELVDPRHNYVQMPGRITMLATTQSGVYVATLRETFFLACTDISDITRFSTVCDYGVNPRTRVYVDGDLLGEEGVSGSTAMWVSKKGVCYGLDGGIVRNMTQRDVVMPAGTTGTAMFRQQGGQNHFVTVIK